MGEPMFEAGCSNFAEMRNLKYAVQAREKEIKKLEDELWKLKALNAAVKKSETTCIGCEHLAGVKRVEGVFFVCELDNHCADRKQMG